MTPQEELKRYLSLKEVDYYVVVSFIQRGASPNTTNAQGDTYLHQMAKKRYDGLVKKAIELGIDVKKKNKAGKQALTLYMSKMSLRYNNIDMIHESIVAFIQAGADPNTTCSAGTYLHLLAGFGSKKHIISALELGIDVTKLNENGQTALGYYLARGFTDLEVINAFIEKEKQQSFAKSSKKDVSLQSRASSSASYSVMDTQLSAENSAISESVTLEPANCRKPSDSPATLVITEESSSTTCNTEKREARSLLRGFFTIFQSRHGRKDALSEQDQLLTTTQTSSSLYSPVGINE